MIDAAAVSLGLPGFVVLADYGGELKLLIETTEGTTGCPDCGVVATLHDRKPRWVRDLPAGGRPVRLVWFKRVWRCVEPLCTARTWSERHPAIAPRAVLTERARVECARRVARTSPTSPGWRSTSRQLAYRDALSPPLRPCDPRC